MNINQHDVAMINYYSSDLIRYLSNSLANELEVRIIKQGLDVSLKISSIFEPEFEKHFRPISKI